MTKNNPNQLHSIINDQFELIDEYDRENKSLRKELMFWKYLSLLYSAFMSLYVIVDLTT